MGERSFESIQIFLHFKEMVQMTEQVCQGVLEHPSPNVFFSSEL